VSICALSGFTCVSVGKICPKVSEKPKRSYVLGLGTLKFFSSKFMVIVSSLYVILAYERFHRNALLSDSRKNLYPYNGLLLDSPLQKEYSLKKNMKIV